MKERVCKNCKWFDVDSGPYDESGLCRRKPPVVFHPSAVWPIVDENGWCGEFCEPWEPGKVNNGTE